MGAIDYSDDDLDLVMVAAKDRGTERDPWLGLNDRAAAILNGSRLLRRYRWWRLARAIRNDMRDRAVEREWRRLSYDRVDERRPALTPEHREALERSLGFR